mmetsp:Transcript_30222/g.60694  ORF Transcript_30222/g.60694 Transcript_30222/m.60694 type:complete len:214 (+) Transcript_30222:1331-1972(+)
MPASRLSLAAVIALASSSAAPSRSTRSLSSRSCNSRSRFSSCKSVTSFSASSIRSADTSTAFLHRLIGFARPSKPRDSLAASMAFLSSSVAASRSTRSFSSFSASLRSASRLLRPSVVMIDGTAKSAPPLLHSSAALPNAAAITSIIESSVCPMATIGKYSRACSNSSLGLLRFHRPMTAFVTPVLPSCSVRKILRPVAVFSITRTLESGVLW